MAKMHIRVPNLATFFLILAAGDGCGDACDGHAMLEKTPLGKKVVMKTSWAINTDFSGYGTTVAVASSVVTGAGAGVATAEAADMYDTGKIKEFGSSDGAGADTK
uniref:Uncharacterized protein n=1 Tax=Oryza barthii TaxID=65489 RepID=A0A0D3GJ05_9ORYZ